MRARFNGGHPRGPGPPLPSGHGSGPSWQRPSSHRWRRWGSHRSLVAATALVVLAAGAAVAGVVGNRRSEAIALSGGSDPVIDRNVRYAGTSAAQRLDLYRPRGGSGVRPLIVEIHGGGFVTGDKAAAADRTVIDALVAHGYAVASVNYRLAGEAPFPAGVLDVKAAVRWLRAHAGQYRLDPGRFGAMGESAGGYMAVMLATTGSTKAFDDDALGTPGVSSAVQAAVDWWGPIDFATIGAQLRTNPACPAGSLSPDDRRSIYSGWLGAPLRTVPATVRAADPTTYLPSVHTVPAVHTAHPVDTVPPVLIEHGDRDCTVPYQQSVALGQALERVSGARVRVEVLHGAGHSADFPVAAQLPTAVDFFDAVLAPRSATESAAAPPPGSTPGSAAASARAAAVWPAAATVRAPIAAPLARPR